MNPILPHHVAIIMDGNGRWANKRLLPRVAGHKAGVEAVRDIVAHCVKKNIGILTVFAFSSENWQRPEQEISFLMELFFNALTREATKLQEQNIRLRFIGDRSRLDSKLQEKILQVEKSMTDNTGLILQVAVNYGGRWDICEAVKNIARDLTQGLLQQQDISEELIQSKLSFADLPDPDLLIRTSGEMRISNFMLWQLAYTEFYFSDVYWPDFTVDEFDKALAYYAGRERRFGKI